MLISDLRWWDFNWQLGLSHAQKILENGDNENWKNPICQLSIDLIIWWSVFGALQRGTSNSATQHLKNDLSPRSSLQWEDISRLLWGVCEIATECLHFRYLRKIMEWYFTSELSRLPRFKQPNENDIALLLFKRDNVDICISINNIVSGRHLPCSASSTFFQIFIFEFFMLFSKRDRGFLKQIARWVIRFFTKTSPRQSSGCILRILFTSKGTETRKCNYGVKRVLVVRFFVRGFLLCPWVYFASKQTPAKMRDVNLMPTQQIVLPFFVPFFLPNGEGMPECVHKQIKFRGSNATKLNLIQ